MDTDRARTYWRGFLEASGQTERYYRSTPEERVAFVDGWQNACVQFATWQNGVQHIGIGVWDVKAMARICAVARQDAYNDAHGQKALRDQILNGTTGDPTDPHGTQRR
jgi:hypothetical protein